MAHFAKISEENKVLSVLTVNNSDTTNADDQEVEAVGQAYLETNNNWPAAQWIQDTEARKNGPGIGMEWDPSNQIFWNIQPFNSWTKNISNGKWEAPVPEPDDISEEEAQDGIIHYWDEENQTWGKCNANV